MGKVILDAKGNLCIVYTIENKDLSNLSGHPVLLPKCYIQAGTNGVITGFDETGQPYVNIDQYMAKHADTIQDLNALTELIANNSNMTYKELAKLLKQKIEHKEAKPQDVRTKQKKKRTKKQEQDLSLMNSLSLAMEEKTATEQLKDVSERSQDISR